MFPLFGGVPGGPELLILFVIFVFMLGVPLAFGVGLFLLGRWSADSGDDDEVELLRDRINTLEEKVAAREAVSGDDEPATAADAGDTDESSTDDGADRER